MLYAYVKFMIYEVQKFHLFDKKIHNMKYQNEIKTF